MPNRKVHSGSGFIEFTPTQEENEVRELKKQVKNLEKMVAEMMSRQEIIEKQVETGEEE